MNTAQTVHAGSATHEVFNQSTPLENYNLFSTNRGLMDAVAFNGGASHRDFLSGVGADLGTPHMISAGVLANQYTPRLATHDGVGNRIDQVEFHPAYHDLMRAALKWGLHTGPWSESGPATHVKRAAGFMMFTEIEPSVLCPVSMTYAVIPALKHNARIAADWLPALYGREYDPRFLPVNRKTAVTMGMGMTEKQGGSDVRANTTAAVQAGDGAYALTGHKWFMSAPMCDAFLVLAQAPGGLTCFFLPRILPGGEVNALYIQRLKDKLGNRANASSEVEFNGARAWAVGDEGRGVSTILEMGTLTRLDCSLGTAGLMRRALALALHHTAQREAFGKRLREQPIMKNVLADLALESEAATALALRLARAFDAPNDAGEILVRRVLTPIAKFWICKRGSHFAQEAMECLGGNGYVEAGATAASATAAGTTAAGAMARIYREMPLNSIWEGAGNIMAIDLLRALRKGPEVIAALDAELAPARGANPHFDRFVATLTGRLDDASAEESAARRLAQDVALSVQAALLQQHAPDFVFEAFCTSRLAGNWGYAFGTLPAACDFDRIIDRAMPS